VKLSQAALDERLIKKKIQVIQNNTDEHRHKRKNNLNGMTGETISKQSLQCKPKERRQRIRLWGG
jgi:hypothetical protein